MRWDFFFRHEHKRFNDRLHLPMDCVCLELPESTTIEQAIAKIYKEVRGARGSQRSGVSEVQNDLGIYTQINGKRMDFSTPRRAALVTFKTWEQLDLEEA